MRTKKILYRLQLTEPEERMLLESFDRGINSIAWTIIKNAHDRGDLKIIKLQEDKK